MKNSQKKVDFSVVFGKTLDPEFQILLNELFSPIVTSVSSSDLITDNGNDISVVREIPRFVPSDHYAGSFSYQWSTYTETQLDSAQGSSLTEQDLINKTGLSPADVKGKLLLDAGVGIARHAEILARWGAFVVGIDLSDAVEAARDNLKEFSNAIVLQANIDDLPFKEAVFDHIVSIGVLHHTPDTRYYTEKLMPFVKPGGRFSLWLYPPGFSRRGEWVPIASQLPLVGFKDWCDWIVDVARDNRGNRWLEAFMGQFPFSTHHPTRERSVLALFDGYTPTFHWTHSPEEVKTWFHEKGFSDIRFSPIPTSVSAMKPVEANSLQAIPAAINIEFRANVETDVEDIPDLDYGYQTPNLLPHLDPYCTPQYLNKLTMEITTLCNLKCAGCPRTTGIEKGMWEDAHIELPMFEKILKNLPQIGLVTLHGIGEPTLHPQFNELVAMAKASGKFMRMKMTTNALSRSVKFYQESVAAGLDEFWISVDSFDQKICDEMRSGTKAEKLKRRVKELIDVGLPVHISMVVSAVNYRDIPATLIALHEAGAPPVHMQEFQDFGDDYGLMTSEQRQLFVSEMTEIEPRIRGMRVILPSYVQAQGEICTAPWFRPAITVQGYMTPCCTTFDPSLFSFTNLSEVSFDEAWKMNGVRQWISKFIKNKTEICLGCGLNPRRFGIENELGSSGKTGIEQHIVKKETE